MEPTLIAGDVLLVRHAAEGRPGDVVVVHLPQGPEGSRPVAVKRLTRVEPDGGLWVESDALGAGTDSWTLGALPADALVAVALLRLPRLRPLRLPRLLRRT